MCLHLRPGSWWNHAEVPDAQGKIAYDLLAIKKNKVHGNLERWMVVVADTLYTVGRKSSQCSTTATPGF